MAVDIDGVIAGEEGGEGGVGRWGGRGGTQTRTVLSQMASVRWLGRLKSLWPRVSRWQLNNSVREDRGLMEAEEGRREVGGLEVEDGRT